MKDENLVSSDELIKVEIPPGKIWKIDVSSVSPSSERMIRRRANARNVSFPNLSWW